MQENLSCQMFEACALLNDSIGCVLPAIAGSMIVVMEKLLSGHIFEVLQAPMHASALHNDTIECVLPATAGTMTVVMQDNLSVKFLEAPQALMHACASC